ncbi:MAG: hypothetical protein M3Q79_03355 [bacterium]|nr:hypothetical protein [bacterium]
MSGEIDPSLSPHVREMSRKGFLGLVAGAVGGTVLGRHASANSDIPQDPKYYYGEPVPFGWNENIAPPTPPVEAPVTSEVITWESQHYLPKEVLVEGAKIADLSVTNPDGAQIINVPLFAVTKLPESPAKKHQLERGAILEIAHPEINPEEIGENLGVPQMGLLGENGRALVMGHRVTDITPDWNGSPEDGNEGALQIVFERLDELQPGGLLTLALTQQAGGEQLIYQAVGIPTILVDFEGPGGGTAVNTAYNWRSGPTDGQYVRLSACHPKGQTKDRIVADFARIN